jgi:hypothetical protein
MTCGSVWHCPVCATKISEKRRLELVQGVENWRSGGGQVLLLTLTVPHYQNDSCSKVLNGVVDAWAKMTNKRNFKRLGDAIGLKGRIRALEVTYGENGWHVHLHILLFLKASTVKVDVSALQSTLFFQWASSVKLAGLPAPSALHGVKVENGDYAAQYVGKWGIEHEMTKGHIKKAKDGYTPFDLLRVASWAVSLPSVRFLDDSPDKAARLFQEYARFFKGRRQLLWSTGLRDLLGLEEEKTDEQLAEEVEEKAARFAIIPLAVWRVVLGRGLRGQVLAVCRQGLDALETFLCEILPDEEEKT